MPEAQKAAASNKTGTGLSDVEMTDATKDDQVPDENVEVIKKMGATILAIQQAVASVDLRALSKLQLAVLKRTLTGPVLRRCVEVLLSDKDERKEMLLTLLAKEGAASKQPLAEELEQALKEAAGVSGNNFDPAAGESGLQVSSNKTAASSSATSSGSSSKPQPIEVGFFFSILVVDFLLKGSDKPSVETFVAQLVAQLSRLNRRTLDFFASKIYGYFARVYNDSEVIRNDLLAIYRTSVLRRDAGTQATTLNLVLRNYVKYNLFDQATQFVSKTTFPENRTNAEFARYLFYIGRMKSIQLQYSDAHSKIMQAIRKAPQSSEKAVAFKLLAWKFALVVELLMGEIPARKHFLQPEFKEFLLPYEEVTKAVRGGSVPQFESVVTRHQALFKEDGTLTLVMRLRYNVIKTGLRKINVSYSKISLADVAEKLGLESVEDATGICGKAIADGVINATIDFEKNALLSKNLHDVYGTTEPQAQLHKRIAFCLQLYNDCVRSMEYPSKKDATSAEDSDPTRESREREEILAESDTDDIDML